LFFFFFMVVFPGFFLNRGGWGGYLPSILGPRRLAAYVPFPFQRLAGVRTLLLPSAVPSVVSVFLSLSEVLIPIFSAFLAIGNWTSRIPPSFFHLDRSPFAMGTFCRSHEPQGMSTLFLFHLYSAKCINLTHSLYISASPLFLFQRRSRALSCF